MDEFLKIKPDGSHNQDTSIDTATELSKPASGGNKLLIQATEENVRFTLDGTTPTTSKGFVLEADKPPVLLYTGQGVTVTVISETAGAAVEYMWC